MCDSELIVPAMRSFFHQTKTNSAGLPPLFESEFVYVSKSSILALYDERMLGTLTVTSSRLVFMLGDTQVAGNLSDIEAVAQEEKTLFKRSARALMVSMRPPTQPAELTCRFEHTADCEALLASLQLALSRKSWLPDPAVVAAAQRRQLPPTGASSPHSVGVSGILRNHEREKRDARALASEASKGPDALMGQASRVVEVMRRYQAQLNDAAAAAGAPQKSAGADEDSAAAAEEEEDGEAQQLRELLMSIGIQSPVTKASAGGSTTQYHKHLAVELAGFLDKGGHLDDERTGGSRSGGGMLALADLYSLWNRARGIELVSPEDLLAAARLLRPLGLGMSLRTFEGSKLAVVQADSHGDDAMGARLAGMAREQGSLDAFQVARALGIPPALAREHLRIAELRGSLCRDEHMEMLSFYPNRFTEFGGIGESVPTRGASK